MSTYFEHEKKNPRTRSLLIAQQKGCVNYKKDSI